MKPQKLLLLLICTLPGIIIAAQDQTKISPSTNVSQKTIDQLPNVKGVNFFTVQRNIGYSVTKPKDAGTSGHTGNFTFNADYNRFIIDGFALGVGLDISSTNYDYGTEDKSSTVMGSIAATYMRQLGDGF